MKWTHWTPTIQATWECDCGYCGGTIVAGDMVAWKKGSVTVHADCKVPYAVAWYRDRGRVSRGFLLAARGDLRCMVCDDPIESGEMAYKHDGIGATCSQECRDKFNADAWDCDELAALRNRVADLEAQLAEALDATKPPDR